MNINRNSIRCALLIIPFILLPVGCNSGGLNTAYPPPSSGKNEGFYLAPKSPVPSARVSAAAPVVTSEFGAVILRLLYSDNNNPVRRQTFYLAEAREVRASDGTLLDYLGILDAVHAPRTESDDEGNVVFSRVPPGYYRLAMATPIGHQFLEGDRVSEEILAEVTAGKITELGERTIFFPSKWLEP
jgi:hypothetical protein